MVNCPMLPFVSNDFMLTEKVNDIEVWHDEDYGESYFWWAVKMGLRCSR